MSNNAASKAPPKCNQAITRLERAIARLERAALDGGAKSDPRSQRLEAELAEMRSLTQSVGERLDHTIGRIRVALDS